MNESLQFWLLTNGHSHQHEPAEGSQTKQTGFYTAGHTVRTSFGKTTKSMQVKASQLEPRDIITESSQLEPIILYIY